MLTIKQVAGRLNISLSLAYRLVSQGEIPCYEIASCKRVDEDDLKAFLLSQRKQVINLPASARHF